MSKTATALMIGVLHGGDHEKSGRRGEDPMEIIRTRSSGQFDRSSQPAASALLGEGSQADHRNDWKAQIRLLIIAFAISA